jgi:hypothetical protein
VLLQVLVLEQQQDQPSLNTNSNTTHNYSCIKSYEHPPIPHSIADVVPLGCHGMRILGEHLINM